LKASSADETVDNSRYMVPDFWSNRGEGMASRVGFFLGTCRIDWLEEQNKRLDWW